MICSAASKQSLRGKGHTDNQQGCRNVKQSLSFPLLLHSRQLATVLRVMNRLRHRGSPVLIYIVFPLIFSISGPQRQLRRGGRDQQILFLTVRLHRIRGLAVRRWAFLVATSQQKC